jgi:hypothetical protein
VASNFFASSRGVSITVRKCGDGFGPCSPIASSIDLVSRSRVFVFAICSPWSHSPNSKSTSPPARSVTITSGNSASGWRASFTVAAKEGWAVRKASKMAFSSSAWAFWRIDIPTILPRRT